jgi:hypothetical protein
MLNSSSATAMIETRQDLEKFSAKGLVEAIATTRNLGIKRDLVFVKGVHFSSIQQALASPDCPVRKLRFCFASTSPGGWGSVLSSAHTIENLSAKELGLEFATERVKDEWKEFVNSIARLPRLRRLQLDVRDDRLLDLAEALADGAVVRPLDKLIVYWNMDLEQTKRILLTLDKTMVRRVVLTAEYYHQPGFTFPQRELDPEWRFALREFRVGDSSETPFSASWKEASGIKLVQLFQNDSNSEVTWELPEAKDEVCESEEVPWDLVKGWELLDGISAPQLRRWLPRIKSSKLQKLWLSNPMTRKDDRDLLNQMLVPSLKTVGFHAQAPERWEILPEALSLPSVTRLKLLNVTPANQTALENAGFYLSWTDHEHRNIWSRPRTQSLFALAARATNSRTMTWALDQWFDSELRKSVVRALTNDE